MGQQPSEAGRRQNGGTNWDAAFRQLISSAASYDILVFLTDGNPTFYGSPQSGGTGGDTTFREVEEGVFSANGVKATNPALKVVGVAIGSDAAVNNIAAVSGPVANDDYFLAANFQDLQNKLEEIATKLCGGTVTVRKKVEGPGGFTEAPGWNFTVSDSVQGSGVTDANGVTPAFDINPPLPKPVTITEQVQPGYSVVQTANKNATCTRNGQAVPGANITNTTNGVSLSVGALDIVTCEFKNKPAPVTINVRKQTANGVVGGPFTIQRTGNSSGSPSFNFTTSAGNNPTPFQSWTNLFPGTYTLTETSLPGVIWNLTGIDCGQVNLGGKSTQVTLTAGQTVNCTFTNQRAPQPGSVTVEKRTVGGLGTFNFTLSGQSGRSVTTTTENVFKAASPWSNLAPGQSYTLGETGQAGWVEGAFTCNAAGQNPIVSASPQLPITDGENWNCKITNTKKGSVTVTKTSVGGVDEFDFSLTGQDDVSIDTGANNNNPGSNGWTNLVPGDYDLAELDPGAAWTQGDFSCNYAGSQDEPVVGAAPTITLEAGQSWTCTVTNTKKGGVTVTKTSVGGVDEFDFSLTGQDDVSIDTGANNNNPGSNGWTNLVPGDYDLAELDPGAAWTQGDFSCNYAGSQDEPVVGAAPTITLEAGQSWTCTVTNTKKGGVTVTKTSVGGVDEFDFSLTGQDDVSIDTGANNNNPGSNGWTNLVPGDYDLAELDPGAAWTQGDFSCNYAGSQDEPVVGAAPTITLEAGQSWTCTVTNTKKGGVTVTKTSVGGVDEFDFSLTGQDDVSIDTGANNNNPGSNGWTNLVPGDYDLAELDPGAAWTQGDFSCNYAGSQDEPVVGAAPTITLEAGQSWTCTVTNTKKGGVTVTKTSVGGVDEFDFSLTGQDDVSIDTGANNNNPGSNGWTNLVPGDYDLAELDPGAAWTQGDFSCNYAGSQDEPVVGAAPTITLEAGQSWTCKITNTKKGGVTVTKTSVGGVDEFDFSLTGQDDVSIDTGANNNNPGSNGWTNLVPGDYDLAELDPGAAWTQGDFSCNYAGSQDEPVVGAAPTITLEAGQSWTCTVTNTKKGGVTVTKTSVGGVDEFDFSLTGQDDVSIDTGANNNNPGSNGWTNLVPGDYDLAELDPGAAWTQGDFSCNYAGSQDEPVVGAAPTITLEAGQSWTCTVTNTKKGGVTVTKTSVGGVDEFDFSLTGQDDVSIDTGANNNNPGSNGWTNLVPGDYDLAELDPGAAWTQGDFSCNYAGSQDEPVVGAAPTITLEAGQSWTCTVTNTKKGGVTVTKTSVGGVDEFDFSLTGQDDVSIDTGANNNNPGSNGWTNLVPGDYDLAELDPGAAWTQGDFSCNYAGSQDEPVVGAAPTITLEAGQSWTCTMTNTKKGGVTVTKTSVGGVDEFDFSLTGQDDVSIDTGANNNNPGSNGWTNLVPGDYDLAELDPGAAWTQGDFSCNYAGSQDEPVVGAAPTITLEAGQSWTCTVTNTKKGGVTVTKTSVGGVDEFDFSLTGQDDVSIDTGANNNNPGSNGWTNLVPGDYDLAELDPGAAWTQGDFSCNYAGSQDEPVVGAAPTITLEAGQSWTCTVTNTKKGTIIVKKETTTPNGQDDSTFDFTGEIVESLGDGGSAQKSVAPGQYSVTETDPGAQWSLYDIVCDDDDSSGNLNNRTATYNVAPGETVECTFHNGQAEIEVEKDHGDAQCRRRDRVRLHGRHHGGSAGW
ncbi:MAG: hypothetical protein M5U31_08305 [Acidimicrobiia bacterium]|nr:hypothetical protein [Acidimicrobiia bacterium]